jgi:hypothetical protein
MKYTGKIWMLALFVFAVACDKENNDDITNTVVINELLPVNQNSGSDQNGEFDDWIELYNLTDQAVDLSGHYLSDSKKNPAKWQFPEGTAIAAKGYLIVWADADTLQVGLHTNYKLSSEGENVLLLTPDLKVMDETKYPPTEVQQSWARIPNGTGGFQWAEPTFNRSND